MTKRQKRFISIICVAIMMMSFFPKCPAQAASSNLRFLSCLDTPAEDADCTSNKADVCNRIITVKKGTQFKIDGWVLSNKKIDGYELQITASGETHPNQKVTPFEWTFPSGLDKTITSGAYRRENSGWVVSVNTSGFTAGKWYILYVIAKYEGNKKSFIAAQIKIVVSNNNGDSYAVCNDSISTLHNQLIDQATMLKYPDNFVVGDKNNAIPVSGWAIHDHGIKSYSYKIYQVVFSGDGKSSTTKLVATGNSGAIKAIDGESAIGDVGRRVNIGIGEPTKNARYSGEIPISSLKAGHYFVTVVGTTLLWESFEVCKVQFTIVPKNHQCALSGIKWQYTHNHVKSDGSSEAVPVYRCVTCNKPNYEAYLYPTTTQHFISSSGSNENNAYNDGFGVVAYDWGGLKYNYDNSGKPILPGKKDKKSKTLGGMSGDQTGNEWFLTEFSSQYGDKQLVAVLRHPDQNKAKALAMISIDAAMNDNIGYDQERPGDELTGRYSYYHALEYAGWNPARVADQCEADCSSGILANLKAIGFNISYDGITTKKGIIEALKGIEFNVLEGTNMPGVDELLPGDILLYKDSAGNGHVATNVSLGKKVKKGSGEGNWHLD